MKATRVALLVAATLVAACSPARITEDTPGACSNGLDDDHDGATDCADVACAATDACERTGATCRNGVDDDGDGFADCASQSCRDGGFCATFEAPCDVLTQQGCPRGMGCYPTEDRKTFCSVGGPRREGEACDDRAYEDPSERCAPSLMCTTDGCMRLCATDTDCRRNSICLVGNEGFGICSHPCVPNGGCTKPDEECVPLQTFGFRIGSGGWAHQCISKRSLPNPGAAANGSPCNPDYFSAPPAERCALGNLCIPEPGGSICRTTCPAVLDGDVSRVCMTGLCRAVVPFDVRPTQLGQEFTVGVCIP